MTKAQSRTPPKRKEMVETSFGYLVNKALVRTLLVLLPRPRIKTLTTSRARIVIGCKRRLRGRGRLASACSMGRYVPLPASTKVAVQKWGAWMAGGDLAPDCSTSARETGCKSFWLAVSRFVGVMPAPEVVFQNNLKCWLGPDAALTSSCEMTLRVCAYARARAAAAALINSHEMNMYVGARALCFCCCHQLLRDDTVSVCLSFFLSVCICCCSHQLLRNDPKETASAAE